MSSEQQPLQKNTSLQAPAAVKTVSFFEAQQKIYPRATSGKFMRWRWAMVWLTQLVFYGLPWLSWGQRPMVLFELEERRFYWFGYVLYPQDFIYLTGLLIISALALFLFTAVAGRLWCGFACPQTVYTELFVWIERTVEGERSARIRLDQGGWTLEKVWKKTLKQLLWIALALWTGFTFVGYFVPIQALGNELLAGKGSWPIFWVLFYGFATYGNAGYMREQVCKYMCPYARFQSAMLDKDTLIMSYDTQRGEARGPRRKGEDYRAQGLGDCIDCTLCVQVCPVGIDIRNGLQYECIGCGVCADACNSVMDSMQYPRGLVRLSTENAATNPGQHAHFLRRMVRPRVLVYSAILLSLSMAMTVSLALREPLKVDILRDRAALARIAPGGMIENVFRLQIMNATESTQHYRVQVQGIDGLALADAYDIEVAPAQTRGAAVAVRIPYGAAPAGSHPITFSIAAQSGQGAVTESSVFLVPR